MHPGVLPSPHTFYGLSSGVSRSHLKRLFTRHFHQKCLPTDSLNNRRDFSACTSSAANNRLHPSPLRNSNQINTHTRGVAYNNVNHHYSTRQKNNSKPSRVSSPSQSTAPVNQPISSSADSTIFVPSPTSIPKKEATTPSNSFMNLPFQTESKDASNTEDADSHSHDNPTAQESELKQQIQQDMKEQILHTDDTTNVSEQEAPSSGRQHTAAPPLSAEHLSLLEQLHHLMEHQNGYDAYEIISQLIVDHPDVPFLYRYRAQTHVSMRSYYDALRDLDKAIELGNPGTHEYDQSLYERALVKAYLNRPISATNDIQQIHNKNSKKVLTLAAWLNDSCEQSISFLDESLATSLQKPPTYPETTPCNNEDTMWFLYMRAKNLELLGRFEEAFETFKQAATCNSNELQIAWQRAGWCCQRMNRHEEAIEYFNKYLSNLNPNQEEKPKIYYETLFSRAFSFFALQQWDLAASDYEVIIKYSNNRRFNVYALINRAFLNFHLGHYAASLFDVRGAIMHDPTNIAAYHLRCHVYEHTRRNTLAKNDIQAILELIHNRSEYSECPKRFIAQMHVKLARLYLEEPPTRHTYVDAMQSVTTALEHEPQLLEALEMRIHIYMKQYSEGLLQKDPEIAETHDLVMRDLDYLIRRVSEEREKEEAEMKAQEEDQKRKSTPEVESKASIAAAQSTMVATASGSSTQTPAVVSPIAPPPVSPPYSEFNSFFSTDRFYYTRGIIHYQNRRYVEAQQDFNQCQIGQVGGWSLIYYMALVELFQFHPLRSGLQLYSGWKELKNVQQKGRPQQQV